MKLSMTISFIWLFYGVIGIISSSSSSISIVTAIDSNVVDGVLSKEEITIETTKTNTVVAAQKVWIIYHKINNSYIERAKITLSVPTAIIPESTSTSTTTIVTTTKRSKLPKDPLLIEYTNIVPTSVNELSLSAEDIATSILSTPFYQLILIESTNDSNSIRINNENENDDNSILVSVPSCNVRRSNYRDEIIIHISTINSKVLSMQYIPKISSLAPLSCTKYDTLLPSTFYTKNNSTRVKTTKKDNDDKMTTITNNDDTKNNYIHLFQSTTIQYEVTDIGMKLQTVLSGLKPPPGLQRIPGSTSHRGTVTTGSTSNGIFDDDKNNKNNNDQQQNQTPPGMFGFFRKYWYIFGPLFLMNMVMGTQQQGQGQEQDYDDSQQQQQQVQGSSQQQGGVVGATSTGTASSSNATSVKQRRGKRG